MKAVNVVIIFLGCWFFLSAGNADERIFSSIHLHGLMLSVMVFFAILVFFKGITFNAKILIFPIFFFYMFIVNLFFGGGWEGAIKVIIFSLVVMMSSYVAHSLSVVEFLKTLVISLFMLLLVNILVSVFYPGIGLEIGYFSGDWKGVFDQKNTLGRLSSLVLVSSLLLIICSKDGVVKLYSLLILVASIMVSINAGSRTGLATGALVGFMTIFFCLLYRVLKTDFEQKKTFLMVLFAEIFVVLSLILANLDVVDLYSNEDGISIFGNFISLTGRLTIWDFVLENISDVHFWFGYGLDNFWTSERFAIIGPMQGMGDFYPEDSHNGYIDILAQGGVLGVILYLLIFLFIFKALFMSRLSFSEYVVVFTFITLFLVSNLTESYTTKSTNIINFLFVYSVAFLLRGNFSTHGKGVITIKPVSFVRKLYISGGKVK